MAPRTGYKPTTGSDATWDYIREQLSQLGIPTDNDFKKPEDEPLMSESEHGTYPDDEEAEGAIEAEEEGGSYSGQRVPEDNTNDRPILTGFRDLVIAALRGDKSSFMKLRGTDQVLCDAAKEDMDSNAIYTWIADCDDLFGQISKWNPDPANSAEFNLFFGNFIRAPLIEKRNLYQAVVDSSKRLKEVPSGSCVQPSETQRKRIDTMCGNGATQEVLNAARLRYYDPSCTLPSEIDYSTPYEEPVKEGLPQRGPGLQKSAMTTASDLRSRLSGLGKPKSSCDKPAADINSEETLRNENLTLVEAELVVSRKTKCPGKFNCIKGNKEVFQNVSTI